jgi:hypothetical protein
MISSGIEPLDLLACSTASQPQTYIEMHSDSVTPSENRDLREMCVQISYVSDRSPGRSWDRALPTIFCHRTLSAHHVRLSSNQPQELAPMNRVWSASRDIIGTLRSVDTPILLSVLGLNWKMADRWSFPVLFRIRVSTRFALVITKQGKR